MRNRLRHAVAALAVLSGLSGTAFGSEYSSSWGPALGSELPVLEAYDQTGQLRTLSSLTGENGLLLLMNRSADW